MNRPKDQSTDKSTKWVFPKSLRSGNLHYNTRMEDSFKRVIMTVFTDSTAPGCEDRIKTLATYNIVVGESSGRYRRYMTYSDDDDPSGKIRRFAVEYKSEFDSRTSDVSKDEKDHLNLVLNAMESLMRNDCAEYPGGPQLIWSERGHMDFTEYYTDRTIRFTLTKSEGHGNVCSCKLVVEAERLEEQQQLHFRERYPTTYRELKRRKRSGFLD